MDVIPFFFQFKSIFICTSLYMKQYAMQMQKPTRFVFETFAVSQVH